MTYTPLQLEAIKLFGRKDLSFGCLVESKDTSKIYTILSHQREYLLVLDRGYRREIPLHIDKIEILGHIPELFPDMARVTEWTDIDIWMSTYSKEFVASGILIGHNIIQYSPTLPLLDQPNLEDIINIFKQGSHNTST